MTWSQAFAIVGFMASVAAIAWAFAWMTVRTEADSGFKFSEPPTWTVETRAPDTEQRQ